MNPLYLTWFLPLLGPNPEVLPVDTVPIVYMNDDKECEWNGIKLYGKVKVVKYFPDIKVKFVDNFPDINVKIVEHFPDECGRWEFVENFPDFTIQVVETFPDLEVKIVENFPGME